MIFANAARSEAGSPATSAETSVRAKRAAIFCSDARSMAASNRQANRIMARLYQMVDWLPMKFGIDFGTTHTVVAMIDRGNYPVVSFEHRDAIPSIAALTPSGEVVYGRTEPGWK